MTGQDGAARSPAAEMPRFRACVLHIGTEKTGTTTLQQALGRNRAALLQAGYWVPACLSPYDVAANHELLTTFALQDAKLNDDLRVKAGVDSAAAVVAHRQAVRGALRNEMAAVAADGGLADRTLLLSNEHCHSRLVEPAEVVRLRDFLAEFADEIRVVVYLRPQHELAVSLYDQALKSGYSDIAVLPDFSSDQQRWVGRGYFDYAALLSRWADAFGRDAITARVFDRASLLHGSIVDDFLALIGVDGADFTIEPNSNVSMSLDRQAVLNAINRRTRQSGMKLTAGVRAGLIGQLQQSSRGAGRAPTRAAAEAFYYSFALSNERARAAFLPERETLFTPDFARYGDREAEHGPDLDAALDFILAQQTGRI